MKPWIRIRIVAYEDPKHSFLERRTLAGEEYAGGGEGPVLPHQMLPQRLLRRTGVPAFFVPPRQISAALQKRKPKKIRLEFEYLKFFTVCF